MTTLLWILTLKYCRMSLAVLTCWKIPFSNLMTIWFKNNGDSFQFYVLGFYLFQADVLEYYDQTVNSPSGSFYIPAVLRVPHLLQVVKRRRVNSNLSRKNILYRDSYICQYCSCGENLTIDHVLPISRGGKWTWENLVAACAKCNSKKGQKTIEEANMKLLKTPKAPKDFDILTIPLTSAAAKMLRLRKGTPEEWRQYLGRSSSEPWRNLLWHLYILMLRTY